MKTSHNTQRFSQKKYANRVMDIHPARPDSEVAVKRQKLAAVALVAGGIATGLGIGAAHNKYSDFKKEQSETVEFVVEPGQTLTSIAKDLNKGTRNEGNLDPMLARLEREGRERYGEDFNPNELRPGDVLDVPADPNKVIK